MQTPRLARLKLISEIVGIWFTITGVCAGGLFALIEYFDRAASERIKITLEYVDRFDKDPLLSARSAIEEFWTAKAVGTKETLEKNEKAPHLVLCKVYEFSALGFKPDRVIEFFDRVSECACAKLCDRQTTLRFFGPYARSFYNIYAPHIGTRRRDLSDEHFGLGIYRIARGYKNPDLLCLGESKIEVSCPPSQ